MELGMQVDPESGPKAAHDDHACHFCTDGCRAAFLADPEPHVERGGGAASQEKVREPTRAGEVVYLRPCMGCGQEAQAPVSSDNLMERRTIEEIERFVRGRWRKRLGRRAYRRDHPRALIRAFLVYALQPLSPVRRHIVEVGLDLAVANLRAAGLNRQQVTRGFNVLSRAMREALDASGLPPDRARLMADLVENRLAAYQHAGVPGPSTSPPSSASAVMSMR